MKTVLSLSAILICLCHNLAFGQKEYNIMAEFKKEAYNVLDTTLAVNISGDNEWGVLNSFRNVTLKFDYNFFGVNYNEIAQLNGGSIAFQTSSNQYVNVLALFTDMGTENLFYLDSLSSAIFLFEDSANQSIIVDFQNAKYDVQGIIDYRYILDFSKAEFSVHFGRNTISLEEWNRNETLINSANPFASFLVQWYDSLQIYQHIFVYHEDQANPTVYTKEEYSDFFPPYSDIGFFTPPDSGMMYTFKIQDATGVSSKSKQAKLKIFPTITTGPQVQIEAYDNFQILEIIDLNTGRIVKKVASQATLELPYKGYFIIRAMNENESKAQKVLYH